MVDDQKFQQFDTMMQLYVNFKHLKKSKAPTHQACKVSAVQGCGGGRQGRGGRGGGGQGELNALM
jgi:hypothetical protein